MHEVQSTTELFDDGSQYALYNSSNECEIDTEHNL